MFDRFNVTATNGESLSVSVSLQAPTWNQAYHYAKILQTAFRDVCITNAETGEVCHSYYFSSDAYVATCAISTCIARLEEMRALLEAEN